MIDTYWSDHCRHTTFGTVLDNVAVEDEAVQAAFEKYLEMRHELGRDEKPVCLMDMGTIGARVAEGEGRADRPRRVRGDQRLLRQGARWTSTARSRTGCSCSRTRPTTTLPRSSPSAARPPAWAAPSATRLSGRSYVYQAMRVTGAADPPVPVERDAAGQAAAAQARDHRGRGLLLATATRSAWPPARCTSSTTPATSPSAWRSAPWWALPRPTTCVARAPAPGDVVMLLGGRTGRDGIGGATGSSKAHNAGIARDLRRRGAEGQRPRWSARSSACSVDGDACTLIKRCNDFGAGGVSVAIGELADGLYIDLDTVPKKYDGLDGTELAISESQERMAVALAAEDVDEFIGYAARGEPRGNRHRHGHRGAAHAHGVERRRHRRPEPRLPQHQRRGEAPGRARAARVERTAAPPGPATRWPSA